MSNVRQQHTVAIVGLALVKFFLYYGVCCLAPRLLHVAVSDRTSFALKWAAVRFAIGIALAYPLFAVMAYADRAGWSFVLTYVATFIVARYLVWYGLARAILARTSAVVVTSGTTAWVGIGIAASFAVDGVAYLGGAENFKFFC